MNSTAAQLELVLAQPRARRRDPATSRAAAAQARQVQISHANRILAALRDGPGSIYALASRAGLDHVQVARQMKGLADAGLARVRLGADGQEATVDSPSGRACRVWEAAP